MFAVLVVAGGNPIAKRLQAAAPHKGSALLTQLSLQDLALGTTTNDWEVIQDHTSSAPHTPARITRRIVITTRTPAAEVQILARNLDTAFERAITRHGASQTGEESSSHASIRREEDKEFRTSLYLPRYYYRTKKVEGIADAWVIGTGSGAVMIVTLTE